MSRSDCSFARLPGGLRVAYVDEGRRDGPTIVMLHGYTDSHRSFDLLRPHLPESWRVVAPTARGHGRSDKPESGYRVDDMAEDVGALLDVLGIERAIIAGHSMGAGVALQVAAAYPERIAGLVLMGAFASFLDKEAVLQLTAEIDAFEGPIDPEFVRAFQQSTFAESIPERFLETVIGESLRCPAHVWRAALAGQLGAAILDTAQRCRAPALLIHGARDALALHDDQLRLRDALPSTRLVTMETVGHTPHWERPVETALLIQAFAGELADTGDALR